MWRSIPNSTARSLRRDALIAVALNMGNESNKEKMLEGHKWTEEGVLRAINRGLGKEEMVFVQKTWDLIETLWPQIAAMERRVNGVAPDKVERSALVTRHGTFSGGYYPMVYEPKRAAEKGDRPGALTAENFGSEVYTRATTAQGLHQGARRGLPPAGAPVARSDPAASDGGRARPALARADHGGPEVPQRRPDQERDPPEDGAGIRGAAAALAQPHGAGIRAGPAGHGGLGTAS